MKKRFLVTFLISLIIFTGGLMVTHRSIQASGGGLIYAYGDGNNVVEPINMDELLILLVGVDDDEKPEEDSFGRTDTMMLLKANFKKGDITILSLPRDSRVDIDGYFDKLNHAHAYGGMGKLLETLRYNFGLDIDYYVKVSFQAVKDLVDGMGGIYLDVPVPISVPSLNVDLQPGYQKLDGNEALMFVRYREGYVDGDIGRVHAQQYFMKEFIKQILSPKNVLNLPNLIMSYYDNIETNILMGQMIRMVPLASELSSDRVEVFTLPGYDEYIDGVSYWIVNWDETNALLDEYFWEYELNGGWE